MAREKPANNNAHSDEIVMLLTQVGQRLIHSEQDRKELKRAMDDLIEKADQGERAYLTIQDRLSKTESALERRAQAIEKAQREQEEKLEKASLMADKMEEILSQHAKINRRLEKVAQERARMIRKLERIEEAVIETHDTINAKMPALLSAQATQKPSLPQALADDGADGMEDRPWWRQHGPVRVAAIAAMVIIGVGGGWLMNQAGYRFMNTGAGEGGSTYTRIANNTAAPRFNDEPPAQTTLAAADTPANEDQTRFSRAIEDALADTAPASGEDTEKDMSADEMIEATADADSESDDDFSPEDIPASFEDTELFADTEKDPLDMTDAELLASLNNDPDLLAARLNDIAVGAGKPVPEDLSKAAQEPQQAQKISMPPQAKKINDVSTPDFLKAQTPQGALRDRIKPDESLPSVIREVELKAFDGVPEAQHDLAAIYTAGHGGVPVNYERAAAWFREAALKGVANARYNLGVLYHQGLGVPQDINTAVSWYRSAAEMGHPEAQYNLGIAYIEGVGTNYDPDMAAHYFEEAARKGILEAAYNLGLIHENGLTGEAHPDEALFWYKQAADQGSPEAKAAMDQLAKTLGLQPGEVERMVSQKRAQSTNIAPAPVAAKPVKTAKAAPPPPPVPGASQSAIGYEYIEAQPLDLSPSSMQREPVAVAETDAAAQPSHDDPATVAQIQEQLIRLGLYPGPADGVNDGMTADAIRSYQAQNNLKTDGRASQALLVHMMTSDLEQGSREN